MFRPFLIIRLTFILAGAILAADYADPSLRTQIASSVPGAKFVTPGEGLQNDPSSLVEMALKAAEESGVPGLDAFGDIAAEGGIGAMYAKIAEAVKGNAAMAPGAKPTPVNLQPSPGAKFVAVEK